MATYKFSCLDCKKKLSLNLSIAEYREFKKSPSCPKCKSTNVERVYAGMKVTSFLKGDGWPGKTIKEKNYRAKRSVEMDTRMRERNKAPELLPNVMGQVVDNWDEAKKLAKSRGVKDLSQFEKKIDDNKHGKNRPKGIPRKSF